MTPIALNTLIPLPHAPAADQILLFDRKSWRICSALDFSLVSNRQQQLQSTAAEIKKIAFRVLSAMEPNGETGLGKFETSTIHNFLVERRMSRHYFSANRLSFEHFTAQAIGTLFDSLQRQAANTIGQWDHREDVTNSTSGDTRKFIDCITCFGEGLHLSANVVEWGKRILDLQSRISHWPASFLASEDLDFCPREIRSLDWLATVCAYTFAEYLRIEPRPDPHFDVYIASLGKCVTYHVVERFDLVGGLWAFGLVPIGPSTPENSASSIVLIRGTEKNPMKEGFCGSWWLNSNPDFPGASLCTSETKLEGHKKLIAWMSQQRSSTEQKLHLVGHSLGGTISVGLALYRSDLVARATAFNAPTFKKMAARYAEISHPPQIIQFINCHDPIPQFDGALIGSVYHLDFMETGHSRSKPREYWLPIAHHLPPRLLASKSALIRAIDRVTDLARQIAKYFAKFFIVQCFLSIEPLPTIGEFLRKLKDFPDSIHQHHSISSTTKRRCIVQKCVAGDCGRTDLIAVRLVFEWMSRTWVFPLLTTALIAHQVCQSQLMFRFRATLMRFPKWVARVAQRSIAPLNTFTAAN